MGLRRFIECPECGERWIIEHDNGEWINADKCPKCGFPTMKPIICGQGTTANRWPEEFISHLRY